MHYDIEIHADHPNAAELVVAQAHALAGTLGAEGHYFEITVFPVNSDAEDGGGDAIAELRGR